MNNNGVIRRKRETLAKKQAEQTKEMIDNIKQEDLK